MEDMRRVSIHLDRSLIGFGNKIILPYLEDDELSVYLSKKLGEECKFLTYDSLSSMRHDGYISMAGEYYNFNIDIYLEL